MDDLCQKLCAFYNTNILDDQNKEIKDEFLRLSLKNLGTGEGKQTLMKLICNHFSGDTKPMPQFIGGPRNLTVHWSDEYQKMIYIFGEYHSDIIDCDDQAKDSPGAKKMSIEYFLGELIRTTDKYLDVFIELPALSNKETRKYHEKFLPLGKGFRLAKLFDQFKECIEYPTRGGENCRLARVHYFDVRNKEDSEGFTASTDSIGYFTIILQYLFNEAEHFKYTDKQFVKAFRSLIKKNKKIMTVLDFMCISDDDKFEKFWITPLTENEYINKELNRLERDNPLLKNLIITYIKDNIIKQANDSKKKWINNTNIVLKRVKASETEFCDTVTMILDDIACIYANVIDAYLLARVFKKFNMEEMRAKAYLGITDQPDRASNIIIYAGDAHSERYRKFLKHVLHFKKIATTGVRDGVNGDGTKIYCIDMKSIQQPLFMYPKKKTRDPEFSIQTIVDKLISGGKDLSSNDRNSINKLIKKNLGFKNPSLLNQDYTNPVHRGIVIVLLLLCKNNPSSPFFPLENRREKDLVLDTIKKLEHNFKESFIAIK